MSLAGDNKRWPGTQSDQYTDDRKAKPVTPPCDSKSQHQFNDNESAATFGTDSYYEQTTDKWGNWIVPEDREYHREATGGTGQAGARQFSDFQQVDGYSGYGVEIPYGSGAAFERSSEVTVDNSRADRGKDS